MIDMCRTSYRRTYSTRFSYPLPPRATTPRSWMPRLGRHRSRSRSTGGRLMVSAGWDAQIVCGAGGCSTAQQTCCGLAAVVALVGGQAVPAPNITQQCRLMLRAFLPPVHPLQRQQAWRSGLGRPTSTQRGSWRTQQQSWRMRWRQARRTNREWQQLLVVPLGCWALQLRTAGRWRSCAAHPCKSPRIIPMTDATR